MKRNMDWEKWFSVLGAICLLLCVLLEALETCTLYYRLHYYEYFSLPEWIGIQNIVSWCLLLLLAAVLLLPRERKRLEVTMLLAAYTGVFFWAHFGGIGYADFSEGTLFATFAFVALLVITILGFHVNTPQALRAVRLVKVACWVPAVCLIVGRLMPWKMAWLSFTEMTDADGSAYQIWLILLPAFLTQLFETAAVLFIGLWGRCEFVSKMSPKAEDIAV